MAPFDPAIARHELEELVTCFCLDPQDQLIVQLISDLIRVKPHIPTSHTKKAFGKVLLVLNTDDREAFLRSYSHLRLHCFALSKPVLLFFAELLKQSGRFKAAKLNARSPDQGLTTAPKQLAVSDVGTSNKAPETHVVQYAFADTQKREQTIDAQAQDAQLVSDLIYCVQGISGKAVRLQLEKSTFRVAFAFADWCTVELRSTAEQFLPVCSHIFRVIWFVESHGDRCIVHNAICTLLRLYIREHYAHCTKWRNLQINNRLTSETLWLYMYSSKRLFRCLADLCSAIDKAKSFGGATLDVVQNVVQRFDGDAESYAVMQAVQKKAFDAYFEFLNDWLYMGSFIDVHNEFMISMGSISNANFHGMSDEELNRSIASITTRNRMCPTVMKPILANVLNAGICVRILLSQGYLKWSRNYENVEFNANHDGYIFKVDKKCTEISRIFVQYLKEKCNLISRMASIHHLYFLRRSDWLANFIDAAEVDLGLNVEDCKLYRLRNLFDSALKSSSLKALDYLSEFSPCLTNCRIEDVIRYVVHYDQTASESQHIVQELKQQSKHKNLLVFQAFSIKCQPAWPLSRFLTPLLMTHFEILFRWLMLCAYAQRQLSKCLLINQSPVRILFNQIFTLVSKLSTMTTCATDTLWQQWLDSVSSQWLTFEELQEITRRTICECLKCCFADSVPLMEAMLRLFALCLRFERTVGRGNEISSDELQEMKDEFAAVSADLLQFSSKSNDVTSRYLRSCVEIRP